MLSLEQLNVLADPIVELYSEYMDSVIQDMVRRMVRMGGITSASAWQLQRGIESGLVYENAVERLSEIFGSTEEKLKTAFESAGVQSMKFDDSIYRRVGLNPLPLNLSPAMAQTLRAGLDKTGGVIENLTKTTATNAVRSFTRSLDVAYLQVSSGSFSYDQAIKNAVRKIAGTGIVGAEYASGRTDQIDVAVRRAVLTGVSQTSGQLQITRMDELGVDLVETSAHIGARPDHQIWEGKIFSRSGTHKHYPDFVASTGYGTGPGLMGWNCRHSFYPYFRGISRPAYAEVTKKEFRDKTVKYNGKDIPIYDATQIQRGIERKIRAWKRQASALESGGISNVREIQKVTEWQGRMRDFVKQTGLQRQSAREWIRQGRVKLVRPVPVKPTIKRTVKPKVKPKVKQSSIKKPVKKPTAIDIKNQGVKSGKEVRADIDVITKSKEFTRYDELVKEHERLLKELDQLDWGDPGHKEVYAKYGRVTDERDDLQKVLKEKIRRALYVDDPNKISIRHTTKISNALRTQKTGTEFFRNVVSDKIKMDDVTIKLTNSRRAKYVLGADAVNVHRYSEAKSIIHELGHHLEVKGRGVLDKAVEFYNRRTAGEKEKLLRDITGVRNYGSEKTRVDEFMSPYMGKIYEDIDREFYKATGKTQRKVVATELISSGIEYLYLDPLAFATTDPDYFDFIINVIRALD